MGNTSGEKAAPQQPLSVCDSQALCSWVIFVSNLFLKTCPQHFFCMVAVDCALLGAWCDRLSPEQGLLSHARRCSLLRQRRLHGRQPVPSWKLWPPFPAASSRSWTSSPGTIGGCGGESSQTSSRACPTFPGEARGQGDERHTSALQHLILSKGHRSNSIEKLSFSNR